MKEREPKEIEVVRGGVAAAAAGAGERVLKDAAALRSAHAAGQSVFAHPHDPLTGVKRSMGAGFAAMSFDQMGIAINEGRTGDAVSNGAIGVMSVATTLPASRDALARAANALPVTRHASEGLAKALDKVGVATVAGRVPLGGAALTGVSGLIAVAQDVYHGDYVKAGGDLLVVAAQAGTVAAGVVAGAVACSSVAVAATPVASPVGGVVAGGACVRGAQMATFAAGEAAAELTARLYNQLTGAQVRGSNIGTLAEYASHRLPSLPHRREADPTYLLRSHGVTYDGKNDEISVQDLRIQSGVGGARGYSWTRAEGAVELRPGCFDMTKPDDATTQLVGNCPASRKPAKTREL